MHRPRGPKSSRRQRVGLGRGHVDWTGTVELRLATGAICTMHYINGREIAAHCSPSALFAGYSMACRSANAVYLGWPMPRVQDFREAGVSKRKPGWRCFVLCLRTGLAGLIRCHRFQCGYLLWLIHAPFFGRMMPHVIGSNSLDIFLYMVLVVANCCRHSSPNIQ